MEIEVERRFVELGESSSPGVLSIVFGFHHEGRDELRQEVISLEPSLPWPEKPSAFASNCTTSGQQL